MSESAAVFEREYARLNVLVYAGALPAFPGVRVVDTQEFFSMTCTRGAGRGRRLEPFLLSRHVQGELLAEAIRHEVAHVAAMFLDEHEGHGAPWVAHSRRLGASGAATLDPGHPLREAWPS